MDLVLTLPRIQPVTIQCINHCRLCLNVLHISDITTPSSNTIDSAAYKGNRSTLTLTTLHHEVNQPCPDDTAWRSWQQFLHLINQCSQPHRLKQPLGPWTVAPQQLSRQWPFLYSLSMDTLYQNTSLGYSIHPKLHINFKQSSELIQNNIPNDAVSIQVKACTHTWFLQCPIPLQDLADHSHAHTLFTDHVSSMLLWEYWLLQGVKFLQTATQVMQIFH